MASTIEGRQFDKDGNLKDWWTKEDEQKFNERADCEVKQYDAIEAVPGVHLNGKLTLGENLADLGGLWLAWLAWLDKAQDAHFDMNAKTDGYTPDQRFWIAYAQQWCTQTRPEQLAHAGANRSACTRRISHQHSAEGSAGVRQELQLQEDRQDGGPGPAGCGRRSL